MVNEVAELEQLLDTSDEIKLYGAGFYLKVVLGELERMNPEYLNKIKCILVSHTEGSSDLVRGIPVIEYQKAHLKPGDCVLLTLGLRYTEEIYHLLKDTKACIYRVDFNMFQERPYQEVKESIQPFIDDFPEKVSGLNMPKCEEEVIAWTCWWQGEEQAPEIVRACLASQKRNLPEGVRHIVVTADNYEEYISLPGHITEKVRDGQITLTMLSDIIRAALLYKYGGFWMDSTLYVCRQLGEDILDHPIYTRNLSETQYCADTMWSGWFLFAKPGNILFCFLMESFFYYFSIHDKIKYYFMVDYLIAIACNTFPEVEKQLKAVPYNNEGAQELVRHLMEPYNERQMKEYIKNTSVQKLTYKLDQVKGAGAAGTVCEYLIQEGRENE
jgi:hypothetical protein